MLSLPIMVSPDVGAALNLYTGRSTGWGTDTFVTAEVLTTYCADAIILAQRLSRAGERIDAPDGRTGRHRDPQ